MRRLALRIEYHGGGFVGWQRQAVGVSVQGVLEQAASNLAGGAPVPCVGAGRTDSGVHANAQVVHLDLDTPMPGWKLRDALNFHARPHPVAVLDVADVRPNWSARFSAIGRAYEFIICNRRPRLVLDRGRAWHVDKKLEIPAMRAAALALVGRHDFTSFRASACQAKSPVRTLDRLEVLHDGETIRIVVEARSFLHHQVRNMVGTLKLVGEGRWQADRIAHILAARDRSEAGPTAPPEGLYLTRVVYPEDPFSQTPPMSAATR